VCVCVCVCVHVCKCVRVVCCVYASLLFTVFLCIHTVRKILQLFLHICKLNIAPHQHQTCPQPRLQQPSARAAVLAVRQALHVCMYVCVCVCVCVRVRAFVCV